MKNLSAVVRSHQYLLFIGPPILFIIAFTLYPALAAILISFTSINLGRGDWHWVGLDNYLHLASLDYLPRVLLNTVLFVGVVSALQVMIGLLLALLLNQRWPFRRTVRTIAILPWVIPAIIVALLFRQVFNGSQLGIANAVVGVAGILPQPWLTKPDLSMWVIIFVAVWRGVPLSMILLLGGLQNIPRDLYEAAAIDGASRLQSLFTITLPLLRPVFVINLIWVTAGNLNHLDIPFALTGGAPSHQTEVLAITLYNQAFQLLDAGAAGAIATLFLLINAVMATIYLYVLRSNR